MYRNMSEVVIKPEKCVHYWIIESPNGPTSKGWCKYCGIKADFFNDLQESLSKFEISILGDNKGKDIILEEDTIVNT